MVPPTHPHPHSRPNTNTNPTPSTNLSPSTNTSKTSTKEGASTRSPSNARSISESDDFTDYDVISDAADPPSLDSSIASIHSFTNDLELELDDSSGIISGSGVSGGGERRGRDDRGGALGRVWDGVGVGTSSEGSGKARAFSGAPTTNTSVPHQNAQVGAGAKASTSSRNRVPAVAAVEKIVEPPPSDDAKKLYETAGLGAEDVRAYVRSNSIPGFSQFQNELETVRGDPRERGTQGSGGGGSHSKVVRVYVDGPFDGLHVGILHQLRQAKLSFPRVHLLVGPFTDVQCRAHALPVILPHVERCELVRHIRWVDEVLFDAPVVLSEEYLTRHHLDLVVVPEGSSVDPKIGKDRLAGYDLIKSVGKALPVRRTRNVIAETYVSSPIVTRESGAPTPALYASRKLSENENENESPVTPSPRLMSTSLSGAAAAATTTTSATMTHSVPPPPRSDPSLSVDRMPSGELPLIGASIDSEHVTDPDPPSPREEFGA